MKQKILELIAARLGWLIAWNWLWLIAIAFFGLGGCASFGDAASSTRSTQPAPRTHAEMMCAANPFECNRPLPRAQPRTHREMMCAANPFEC